MKGIISVVSFVLLAFGGIKISADEGHPPGKEPLQVMRDMMINIFRDNEKFRTDCRYDDEFFKNQDNGQQPRVTFVGCADSRVHTSNFDLHPLGDVFFIRNIGNQLETCLGSVEYGVLHAKTPLLFILGHSKCGAVIAVSREHEVPSSIRHELEPMQLTYRGPGTTDEQIEANVIENVQNQVEKAFRRYEGLIQSGKLWVVGAVYDFTENGHGKLTVVQINDKKDQLSIDAFKDDVMTHGIYLDDPGRVPSERQQLKRKGF